MGQQLSSESYCRATIQKLLAELNTTDSRVSESHVTLDTGTGTAAAAACVSVDFTWREWARVSKYLERVLPGAEQKRLLNHVLLDRTGLRQCRSCGRRRRQEDDDHAVAAAVGNGHDGYYGSNEDDNVEDDNGEGEEGGGGGGCWSVHLNYGDDGGRNPILYRDYVKLHFQLDGVPLPAHHRQQQQQRQQSAGDNGDGPAAEVCPAADPLAERLADLVKRRCGRIGINLVVTKAKHHASECIAVVSGTVDVRSVLRNADQLELRSRLNPAKSADQELSDQLVRSAAGLRDRLDTAASAAAASATAAASAAATAAANVNNVADAAAAAARGSGEGDDSGGGGVRGGCTLRYFPMRLSYSETTNRVTLVYAQEARTTVIE